MTRQCPGSSKLRRLLLLSVSFVGLPITAMILSNGTATAQTIASGFDANQLARNDDGSTGAVSLPFAANYFGTTYSQLYVNNNGNVTFSGPSGNYTPVGLGESYLGLPVIAPFFSDVDTRNAASGVTSYGTGTFAGQAAFGVTWPAVGYFSSLADRTNTFQLILTNRGDTGSGNFDIYFNYGSIQWETGNADGGVNGLGGTSASAGFSAGTGVAGTYYELPGSLVNGAFLDGGPNSLAIGSNNGVPGQFLFPVRNGVVLVANVCQTGDNASTTTVANCGPNRVYDDGIFYTPTGPFTLNVLADTTINAAANASAVLVMPAPTNGLPALGAIAVNVSASATIRSDSGAGIEVDGTYSAGTIAVTNAGRISATSFGITVGAAGSGFVTMTNSGTIAVGSSGIGMFGSALATTDFAVGNSGRISGGIVGVAVNQRLGGGSGDGPPTASGATLIENASGGVIQGSVDGIQVATGGGAVTLRNAGTIAGGDSGIVAGNLSASTLTIENLGGGSIGASNGQTIATFWDGTVNVSNAGTITGYGTFAPVAPGGTTGPAVRFDNLAGGIFAARGETNFGGTGVFNNLGTVSLGPVPDESSDRSAGSAAQAVLPPSAIFSGLSQFNNAGTISLANGRAGDTFVINGNYVGQRGSLLLDFSTQTSTSDQLVINGSASGSTGIVISNLTAAVPFSVGAPVVTVRGSSTEDAFTLRGLRNFGTLEGLLVSDTVDGVTTLSLGAVPNAVGLSAGTALIAARTISFQGGQAVLDRIAELRQQLLSAQSGQPSIPQTLQYTGLSQYTALVSKDPIAPKLAPPPPPSNVRTAVWARGFGDYESRSGFSNFGFGGAAFTRNLGYNQATGGFLAGTDLVISRLSSADDGLILGVMAGYTVAGVRLNQQQGRQDFEGATVGAYATYLRGPFFIDTLFKADLLGLDITAPGLRQSTGLQNYNFTSNIGYRIPLQNNFYVEPTAGVEYVSTNFDRTFLLTGTTVPLRDGDALRVRGGARVGSETILDNTLRIEPSITGYVYSVVSESGLSGAFNGVTSVTGLKEEGKVRGEVQASINFFNLKNGISAFVRADGRFGEDLLAGGGRVGVRYQW